SSDLIAITARIYRQTGDPVEIILAVEQVHQFQPSALNGLTFDLESADLIKVAGAIRFLWDGQRAGQADGGIAQIDHRDDLVEPTRVIGAGPLRIARQRAHQVLAEPAIGVSALKQLLTRVEDLLIQG